MKINVTVELDWLDPEGNIDEEVRHSIINGVKSAISRDCLAKVEGEASTKVNEALEEAVKSATALIETRAVGIVEEWLEREIVVTDKWGNESKKGSIMSLIQDTFDDLTGKYINGDGSFCNRGDHRAVPLLQWLTKDKVEQLAQAKIKTLSKDIDAKIESYINAGIRDRVSDKFAELVVQTARHNHRHTAIEAKED